MAKRKTPTRSRTKPGPRTVSKSQRLGFGHPVVLLILFALLVAGIASRVYFLDRSLWLDEAWVANSMLEPSLRGALYYSEWLQTSPPLFIALGRFFTYLFGTSNAALRFLPAFSGVIAVLLMSFLAFKLLRPSFALIAVLLFVFSPRVILYSQSVKQYSTDVFATIALLALGLAYLEKRSDRWFYGLLAGVVVLSFLSYPAMLFFPFVLFCAFTPRDIQPEVDQAQSRRSVNWQRGALAVTTTVVVCAINYVLFIAPNKNSTLTDFFHDGFFPGNSPTEFLIFYADKLSTLTQVFFFGGPGPLRVGASLISAFGLFCLWMPLKEPVNDKSLRTAALCCSPIVGVVALNILKLFPLPGFQHRVLLFVFPVTVLLFCLGLQAVANLTSQFLAARFSGMKATFVESGFGAVVFLGLAGLVWLFFNTVGLMPYFAEEHEDCDRAVAYLRRHLEAGDVLFVHATMREQFKLYTRGSPLPVTRIIYGKIGMPCCPRSGYRNPQQESEKDFTDEITALSGAAMGRLLWVLMTNRDLHWFHLQRNDATIIDRNLAINGCQKLAEEKFTGVYVAGFGCR